MDFRESNQVFVEATHNAGIVFIMHTRKKHLENVRRGTPKLW